MHVECFATYICFLSSTQAPIWKLNGFHMLIGKNKTKYNCMEGNGFTYNAVLGTKQYLGEQSYIHSYLHVSQYEVPGLKSSGLLSSTKVN